MFDRRDNRRRKRQRDFRRSPICQRSRHFALSACLCLKPREHFYTGNDILSQDLDKSYFITSLGVHLETQKNDFSLGARWSSTVVLLQSAARCNTILTPKALVWIGEQWTFCREFETSP
jgi:hypothetical protein